MILDLRQEILQMQKLLSGMDGTLSSHTASLDSLRCTVDGVFFGHARSKSKLSGLDRCMESTSEGPEEQDPAFSSFAVNINTEVNERLDTLELVQAPKDPPALLPLPGVIAREGPDDSSLVHQHATSATPLEKDNEMAPVQRRNSQKKSLERRQSRDSEPMQARKSDGVRKIRSLESGPRKLRYGMVEELQEETARQLLKNSHDLHASDGGPPGMLVKSNTMKSVKQDAVRRMSRLSMDQLRENYDAVLASPLKRMESNVVIRQQRTVTDAADTPLPSVGWLLLALSGIVDVRPGRLWQVLSHWHVVDASLLAVALGYLGACSNLHHFPAITTACYLLGAMIAILGVRHAGITAMIGPYERRLDEYAADYGFTEDWRQLSRYRLVEVLVFWCLMMACRILAALLSSEEIFGGLPLSSFGTGMMVLVAHLLMSLRLSAVCYTHFHVCSGLELAIDNFCLRLFKDQDMEGALSEWNVLSATLRQASQKTCWSLLALGAACTASLVLFASQVVQMPEILGSALDTALWLGWLYPPLLLFLYAMYRAASVTEKAMRVAPLVNSWEFEPAEENGETVALDPGRQYVVQFINQSEAGFYVFGVRISAYMVQKLAYYFLAVTVGLIANLTQ
ncbi:unnamed protein product [Symbiodinium sp. CCMP2592]|nr:unnamed protein product [Symbiodinium sp. CCMP2592]